MMNNSTSQLLLKTFDGSLTKLKLKPKCRDSRVEFAIKYFDYDGDGYLYHGDYDYDAAEENDMLNWREPVEELYKNMDKYHLYQQQTQGGIYYILAGGYEVIVKNSHS